MVKLKPGIFIRFASLAKAANIPLATWIRAAAIEKADRDEATMRRGWPSQPKKGKSA
jgi:hypothetical protein